MLFNDNLRKDNFIRTTNQAFHSLSFQFISKNNNLCGKGVVENKNCLIIF